MLKDIKVQIENLKKNSLIESNNNILNNITENLNLVNTYISKNNAQIIDLLIKNDILINNNQIIKNEPNIN